MLQATDPTLLLAQALRHHWNVRASQGERQRAGIAIDRGRRSETLGGRHMDGFSQLAEGLLIGAGMEQATIGHEVRRPGWILPGRRWDMVAESESRVVLGEWRSQAGSVGKNCANRIAELAGIALDARKSAGPDAHITHIFLIEDCLDLHAPRRRDENRSYAERYALAITRLMDEGLLDSAALLVAGPGAEVAWSPDERLSIEAYARALTRYAAN